LFQGLITSSCSPKILSVLYMAYGTSPLLIFAGLSLVHCKSRTFWQLQESGAQQTWEYSFLRADDAAHMSMSLLQKGSALRPSKRAVELQSVENSSTSTSGEEENEKGVLNQSLTASKSNNMVFIHIPKTGGTSIEEAGLKQGIVWGYPKAGWFAVGHKGESCNKRHVPPYLHPEDYNNKETFCIVRDPYSRMISEYRYLRSTYWGGGFGIHKKQECAEDLNNWVQDTLRTYIYEHFMHDCHVIPQSQFIWGPDGQRWCQNILRFEHLTDSVNAFMERQTVPVRLTLHDNEAKQCPDLSARDLTAESLSMVQIFYKDDFNKLNYSLTP